jgi:hypothetical protein
MNCFSNCFCGTKEKDNEAITFANIVRKTAESRRLSLAYVNIFRGNTIVSPTLGAEVKEKSNDTTNKLGSILTDKPLKRIATAYTKRPTFIGTLNDKDEENPNRKKFKTHWVPKDKLHCYFCGGEKCKHENWKNCDNPAITGLHSNFITEEVIASQRPSTILIQEHNLIEVFKQLKIGLIVNVQREGEHPYCGPNKGLEDSSGFAYDPHRFISEDVRVRQTGWKDMSVPDSMNFMLEIVKDMATTIYENGYKVLVHCHAGFGRTGVVIACFLIYVTNKSVDEIIEFIRDKRSGCIQKSSQFEYCQKFKTYIDQSRPIFCDKNSIEFYMKRQSDLLFGDEAKKYEFVPKLTSIVLDKLIDQLNHNKISKDQIYKGMFYPEIWTDDNESLLMFIKQDINSGKWESLQNDDIEIQVLAQLLYDWLEDCVFYVINPEKIFFIFEEKGFSFLIDQHLKNYREFTKNNRKSLSDNIKFCLRTIESETLCCIAHFMNKIKPDEAEEDTNKYEEYFQVSRRICASLLGFSTKKIKKDKEEIEKMLNYSVRLNNLITLFGIVLEYDVEDEIVIAKKNLFSPYVNRRKVTEHIPRMSTQTLHMLHNKISNDISGGTQPFESEINPAFSNNSNLVYNNNNKIKININNSYNNVNDYVMYEVYKVLESCTKKDKENAISFDQFMLLKDSDNEIINKLKGIFKGDVEKDVDEYEDNNIGYIETKRNTNFNKGKRESHFSFGGKFLKGHEEPIIKLNRIQPTINENSNRDVSKSVDNSKIDKTSNGRSSHKMPILNLMQRVSESAKRQHKSITDKNNNVMFKDIEDQLAHLRKNNSLFKELDSVNFSKRLSTKKSIYINSSGDSL